MDCKSEFMTDYPFISTDQQEKNMFIGNWLLKIIKKKQKFFRGFLDLPDSSQRCVSQVESNRMKSANYPHICG